ncbi:hypothetical protein BH24ACI5_BH24ACI5_19190 [soil metagenome]
MRHGPPRISGFGLRADSGTGAVQMIQCLLECSAQRFSVLISLISRVPQQIVPAGGLRGVNQVRVSLESWRGNDNDRHPCGCGTAEDVLAPDAVAGRETIAVEHDGSTTFFFRQHLQSSVDAIPDRFFLGDTSEHIVIASELVAEATSRPKLPIRMRSAGCSVPMKWCSEVWIRGEFREHGPAQVEHHDGGEGLRFVREDRDLDRPTVIEHLELVSGAGSAPAVRPWLERSQIPPPSAFRNGTSVVVAPHPEGWAKRTGGRLQQLQLGQASVFP